MNTAYIRQVALQITKLCEISSDLMNFFYNPIDMDKAKGKQAELKKLSEIHQRLETWRRELPKELEPKEGGLPNMLVMQYVCPRLSPFAIANTMQYVLPDPLHPPLPTIPQIQSEQLAAAGTCITTEIMHPGCCHDFQTPPSLQTIPRSTTDM